jgi:hypothetical protein
MTTQEALDATALRLIDGPVKAAIRALDEGSVELVLPFVGGPPPAPMDRSDARIQEALRRGRSLVAHASRQYVASTWTNVIGRFRPFRPVGPGGTTWRRRFTPALRPADLPAMLGYCRARGSRTARSPRRTPRPRPRSARPLPGREIDTAGDGFFVTFEGPA